MIYQFRKKDYNEIKILTSKQSVEQVLLRKVMETAIRILFDKSVFDAFPKTDRVSKDF